ncbi:DcuS/MalK family sensor histidine kinase [Virgibacillus ihumii]|uniref:DcuS/MalK family sensor histidine kinase n=1 Tax=Virgibacillus ihumii TaxID=2686091 RepID=UPI00157C7AE5|nr:DcuS/MalK family sensor histidine kinase [Virgibacillus ihumii]
MRLKHKGLSLQVIIILFVCTVVILAFSVTGFLISRELTGQTKNELAEKTRNIARMVSHSPLVIKGLQDKQKEDDIQEFALETRQLTNVRYIVVFDMNGIRKSHPDEWKIGNHFVGGDEQRALNGKSYSSIAKGTLGMSMRWFEPVFTTDGNQVGVVAVGIMLDKVNEVVQNSNKIIYTGVGLGIVLGVLGGVLLAGRIKKILFGLEPPEIANLWQERNAMLESVREGIVAINQEGYIVIANAEAVRIFERAGIDGNPIGHKVDEYMEFSRLIDVLEYGKEAYDQERDLNGMTIVVNRLPVRVDGQIVGAIATFRDKTELKQLAEQLSGVKKYADALRVKSHEFMNKLHVILGMVNIGEYKKLQAYIHEITDKYQMEVGSISSLVKDPILAGFLLSKMSYAREQGVKLNICGDSVLPLPSDSEIMDKIITIIGNLIDNAMEAVQDHNQKEIEVRIGYDNKKFSFSVQDNKGGIPAEVQVNMFSKGFSTKGENRGFGLFLVRKNIEKLGGNINLFSNEEYTMFTVEIPYQEKEESA